MFFPNLQECCHFVHELKDVAQVDEGNVEDSPDCHEDDGVEILYLGIVHYGGYHKVEADDEHQDSNN